MSVGAMLPYSTRSIWGREATTAVSTLALARRTFHDVSSCGAEGSGAGEGVSAGS